MKNERIVTLKRTAHLPNATIGELKVGWKNHSTIFTLENPERQTAKDSRIPAGKYKCVPYSGTKYKDVFLVKDVKDRSAILFHWGNTEKDTEGCIILGNQKGNIGSVPAIFESRICFARFRALIGNEPFELHLED